MELAGKSKRIKSTTIAENRTYNIYFKSGNHIKIELSNRQRCFTTAYREYIEGGSSEGVVQECWPESGRLAIKWSEVEAIHEVY
ncbi:hypothetical protein [Shewanella gelidii]|uniref:Uncharacterized protein n=1 Tax=Shewanella gelidii TaxID=1642821 RepID=A0A917NBN6_9GAMM|nr:hypothetical protein [Shewanella gelidii]MCL1098683.1 hypothetical protein [Shewanella gelidii]GGI86114.1 hypothetical protein GCM10009332_24270 [Shewanella gelidii]